MARYRTIFLWVTGVRQNVEYQSSDEDGAHDGRHEEEEVNGQTLEVRQIGDVDVARGESGRDESQTGVPVVSGHELRDRMQDAQEADKAVQSMVRDIEKGNPSGMETEEDWRKRSQIGGACG